MFIMLYFSDTSPELLIQYIDEDYEIWGSEVWDAANGRMGGSQFIETDFDKKLRTEN